MTNELKRQTIDVRRIFKASHQSAKKRSLRLSTKYGFKILDEFISDNLHVLMADLTQEQISKINEDKYVHSVEDMSRIRLQ